MRAVQSIGHLLQPLEDIIHHYLIPALSGRNPCSELERELLSLPCRLGGMNSQSIVMLSILVLGRSVLPWPP